jgi:NAD+ kinase
VSAPAKVRAVTVLTHQRPGQTAEAIKELQAVAERAGATLRFDPEETGKHGLVTANGCVLCDAEVSDDVDLCIVLGGDGTILRGLRRYAARASRSSR